MLSVALLCAINTLLQVSLVSFTQLLKPGHTSTLGLPQTESLREY